MFFLLQSQDTVAIVVPLTVKRFKGHNRPSARQESASDPSMKDIGERII